MAATNLVPDNPYGSTSVEKRVTDIASKDSALNQMAATEATKVMNRRGMLNSSMAIGAAQDAVLKSAVPIASQDAAQAFQGQENSLDRTLQTGLQSKQIASTEKMQGIDIASKEKLTLAQIASTEGMAAAQRALDDKMQKASIDAATQSQLRDIASKEGMASADRELQKYMQSQEITAEKDMQADELYQEAKIADWQLASSEKISDAQIASSEKVAGWQLSADDRNAAAQLLTNMETLYQSSVDSIMANEYLDAEDRDAYLAAAKEMRDRQIDFVQQMYDVDLQWVIAALLLPALHVLPKMLTAISTAVV